MCDCPDVHRDSPWRTTRTRRVAEATWAIPTYVGTDQDRCEGSASLEVRVLPDGRGGDSTQALRRHSGTYPTTANRARHGSVMTPRNVAEAGTRRWQTGRISAPRRENRSWLGTNQALGGPKRALKSAAPRRMVRKAIGGTGGALYKGETRPGGVAGRGYMGNLV